MPAYKFEALDDHGKPRGGLVEADNPRAARAQLRTQGLVPLDVKLVGAAAANEAQGGRALFARRVFSATTLAVWTRQLAGLVSAGLPLERALTALPGFEDRLRSLFPGLGPLRRQPEQISLAHVLETATLALQAQAGCPVTFSRTTATLDAGVYQVVVEYSEEDVGRKALAAAEALIEAARTPGAEFDADARIAELRELDEDVRLGPSTGSIVNAGLARGIPFRRLTQGSLVQFGWGVKQRRIWAAEVDTTSAVSESIAQDKDLTKTLLRAAGVPVPLGRPVDSVDDAWEMAQEIGLPVVIKPQDGNQGKGVTVNVSTREAVMAGFDNARKFRDDVLVERYLVGSDYRILIVGDKLVAAARREPPLVVGDGTSTVTQLVAQVNLDPRRGTGHATPLTRIRLLLELAWEALEDAGIPASSIENSRTGVYVGLHLGQVFYGNIGSGDKISRLFFVNFEIF